MQCGAGALVYQLPSDVPMAEVAAVPRLRVTLIPGLSGSAAGASAGAGRSSSGLAEGVYCLNEEECCGCDWGWG